MNREITFCDEADETTRPLDRLGGVPVGLRTEDWPRCHGVAMQLFATVELEGRSGDRDGAALVFIDSFYETDAGHSEALAVRLVSRADIEQLGETTPPADFEAEPWPEDADRVMCFRDYDEDEAVCDGECFIGPAAVWPEDTGEPDEVPPGAFLFRLISDEAPFCRVDSALHVFEGGAIITLEDDDEGVVPWAEAIAATHQLVVSDAAPDAGAVIKYGGAPRAYSSWPKDSRGQPLTHLMTLPAKLLHPSSDDDVAYAYFIDLRRVKQRKWSSNPDFVEIETIDQYLLDLDDPHEPPDGVTLLPERALELKAIPEGKTWRALRRTSFLGPRGAYLNPAADHADSSGFQLQLNTNVLPEPGEHGMLYFIDGGYPYFQRAGETGSGRKTAEDWVNEL